MLGLVGSADVFALLATRFALLYKGHNESDREKIEVYGDHGRVYTDVGIAEVILDFWV